MNFEINRLRTFQKNWKCNKIDCEYLARIGMINIGKNSITQCVFCKNYYQWTNYNEKIHGTAAQQHYKSNPRCPFFLYNKLNVSRRKKNLPIHTLYTQTENRLSTLSSWPSKHLNDIADIAKKGIFYLLPFNLLVCFYCGVTNECLTENNITPLTIHNESPCKFLKLKLNNEVKYKLKNKEITCVICLNEQPDIVTFPCRHCCCCRECFIKSKKKKNQCVVCRAKIENFIKIFYA